MRCDRFVQATVADFIRTKNALKEPFAEPLNGAANPRHFNDVNAGAENHDKGKGFVFVEGEDAEENQPRYSSMSLSISFTAAEIPTLMARLTMLCPMLSSTRCGTADNADKFS